MRGAGMPPTRSPITRAAFSISLPPEMAAELERIRREEHRRRSEVIREALRRYFSGKSS